MTVKKRMLGTLAVLSVGMVVFTTAIVAVAAAQGDEEGKGRTLVQRVATILGIEEDTVQDAFDQARQEIAEEKREESIDALVEKDLITEEDAEELRVWWADAPEGLVFGLDSEHRGKRGFFGGGSFGKFGLVPSDRDYSNWLDMLVEEGVMTREDADEIESWLSEVPDISSFSEEKSDKNRFWFRSDQSGRPFGRFGVGGGNLTEWIDSLVEEGVMTQEDADELKSWIAGMPEFSDLPKQKSYEYESEDGRFKFRGHWRRDHWDSDDDDDSNLDGESQGTSTGISLGDPA